MQTYWEGENCKSDLKIILFTCRDEIAFHLKTCQILKYTKLISTCKFFSFGVDDEEIKEENCLGKRFSRWNIDRNPLLFLLCPRRNLSMIISIILICPRKKSSNSIPSGAFYILIKFRVKRISGKFHQYFFDIKTYAPVLF